MYKYETLATTIREKVIASMSPHEAIPSERDLGALYGVSRPTVRQAIAKLVDEGLLYNVHGSGTYVGSTAPFSKTPKLTSFTEDMRSRGHAPSSRLLIMSRASATAEIAGALNVEIGFECVHLKRLRLADDQPMAIEDVYVPSSVLDIEGFTPGDSLYARLADSGHEVHRAEQEIQAISLDDETAVLLGVVPGSPALEITRVSSDRRGRNIEFARTLYRADRYSFQLAVTREAEK